MSEFIEQYTVRLHEKGQLTLPPPVREKMQVEQDDLLAIVSVGDAYLLMPTQVAHEVRVDGRTAKRKATGWLISEVGNMLIAGEPELGVGEPTVWRLPVLLASSIDGVIGNVGTVDVDSQTGQLLTNNELSDQILANVALI